MRRVIALGVAMLFIAGVVSVGVAAEKASHRAMTHKVVGEVVSVDPTAKTLSIKETLKKGGEAKEMSFTLADNVKVMVHGKAGALTDLKAGDSVTVKHVMKDGKDTAEEIMVAKPKTASAKPATKPAAKTETPAAPPPPPK